MSTQTLEYDLYLDETGRFQEGIVDPKQREAGRQRGASQLAGLVLPRNKGDSEAAKIVADANRQANFPPRHVIHATEIIEKNLVTYLRIVDSIIKSVVREQDWQCVRLVNAERISYFDRPTTYANLIAEVTLRTFQQKLRQHPQKKICIRLIDQKYKPGKGQSPLSADEYRKRISEYLGFAEVRYGLTRESRNWRFDGVVERTYRDSPTLQICDVLSHASADKFERLRTQRTLAETLKGLFGEYDFTLTIRELFERVDDLVKEHSFGMALMILAESLVHAPHATKQDQEFAAKLEERLGYIIGRLGRMDFRGRDPQLALLVGWLDQLVGQQRLLDKGYEIAHWLLEHLETALRTHLATHKDEPTLDWFAYSLRRWALTACNHKGVLLKAQTEMEAMQYLQPSVAMQWERIPLVMDGLIAQAVHYTDCFEFDKASQRMRFVADSLKMQANEFHRVMKDDFPATLRFDLRARALGTLVQSEIFAGTADPARLQSARNASEEAMAEFNSLSDRARQYQYRCHLETVARDYDTARKYLVWSLEGADAEPTEYSHNRIADLIADKSVDPEWKAEFTLLHWLRIGAYACLNAHEASHHVLAVDRIAGDDQIDTESEQIDISIERDKFLAALDRSEQLNSGACQGRLSEYPAHSILRFVAVINAARRNWDESIRALQHLHALDPVGKEQFVLAMILLAAQTEVAALVWEHDEAEAYLLLDHNKPPVFGLKQLIQKVEAKHDSALASISALCHHWLRTISHLVEHKPRRIEFKEILLKLAGANVY